MPLSDIQIRNLKPKEKPYKVSDFDGLYVTVTPTGSRLWHMKYRIEGREKRMSFGAYPAVTLAKARALRDEARKVLANGQDPGAVKQEQKRLSREADADTFAKFAEAYVAKRAKKRKPRRRSPRPNGCLDWPTLTWSTHRSLTPPRRSF